jgi:hypothetical protein
MMAVTVVCDEKSMVDRACEWGHSLLPHKAGRTMSAVPRPLLKKREKWRTRHI